MGQNGKTNLAFLVAERMMERDIGARSKNK